MFVLRDLLDIEMLFNLVFLLMFCFVLVVLLSLSIAITQLAEKCKRLTQANAILEHRVRAMEDGGALPLRPPRGYGGSRRTAAPKEEKPEAIPPDSAGGRNTGTITRHCAGSIAGKRRFRCRAFRRPLAAAG